MCHFHEDRSDAVEWERELREEFDHAGSLAEDSENAEQEPPVMADGGDQ